MDGIADVGNDASNQDVIESAPQTLEDEESVVMQFIEPMAFYQQHQKIEDSAEPHVVVMKLGKSGIESQLNVRFSDVAQIWTEFKAVEAVRHIPCQSLVAIYGHLFEEFKLQAEDSLRPLGTVPVVFRGETGKRWKEAYDKRFEEGMNAKAVGWGWPEIQEG